jgi:Ca-activated chloride channel family protein
MWPGRPDGDVMRAGSLVVASLGVVCTGVLLARPQDPQQPTFRAVGRVVPVYATVTDPDGQFVLNLTKDDFEIRDNGKLQDITQFSMKLAPMTGTILIDGSQSIVDNFDLMVGAADAFVVRMMAGDRIRIGSFAEDVRLGPDPTDDRDELIRFLRNPFSLRMGIRTRLWDAIDLAIEAMPMAESRRIVLVLTDGQDTFSVKRQVDVISRARREDVMVYAIRVPSTTFEPRSKEEMDRARLRAAYMGTDKIPPRPPDGLLNEVVAETGGSFYDIDQLSELNSIATQITTELHSQYVLGFTPEKLDGKIHKIDVRVKPRGYTARARRSYLAAPEAPPRGAPGPASGRTR